MTMADVTIVDAGGSAGEAAIAEPALEVAAVEAGAEAAVAIAEIEADRDVAIEVVRAEVAAGATEAAVEIAAVAAQTEAEELAQCLTRVANLETGMAEVREAVLSIQTHLITPEPEPLPSPPVNVADVRTPESPEDPITEALAPPAQPRKPRLRLI